MSCRTEKERISLCSERLVVYINSDCISCLVLECEGNVILDTVLSLILSLHFCVNLLEKLLVLRRDCNHKICGTILISHIVLSLNEMLSESSTDLSVRILMELEHSLRLCAITKTFICQGLCKHVLSVLRALACLLAEKFRSIECE